MQYGTVFSRYTNMGKQKQKTKTERMSPIQQARSELERDRVPREKNCQVSLSSAAKMSLTRGRAYKNLISLDALPFEFS